MTGKKNHPSSMEGAIALIEATRDKNFLERFQAFGFDPQVDFAGGDWRNCNFSKCDLRGADFRNSRLFFADFRYALVQGVDFTGAGDVHTAKIHLAIDWQGAIFTDNQRVLIEAELQRMIDYNAEQQILRRDQMDEKEWFYAIKACRTFPEAHAVLDQMELAGYALNPFAYSYVLDRAKRDRDRKQGWQLFNHFLRSGGEPDEALYTAGIGVSPDSQTALEVFDALQSDMRERNKIPGERAYNMVISEQDDNFSMALRVFHEMRHKEISVSRYTIYALFDACSSFANAVTVVMEARRAGVDIDDETFVEELCNTTRYPDLSEENIRQWRNEGISYRDVIGRLINKLLGGRFRNEALAELGFQLSSPSSTQP